VFNGEEERLLASGVHLPLYQLNKHTAGQDLEAEYIAVGDEYAYVVCQENNAIVRLRLADLTFDKIIVLGYKDYGVCPIDASNTDNIIGNLLTRPNVRGIFQPDAIRLVTLGGKEYLITANEGDAKDYSFVTEEARAEDIADEALLAGRFNLPTGRLVVTTVLGKDPTNPSVYSTIFNYGARSFSIWDAEDGSLVYDSHDSLEALSFEVPYTKDFFNANDGSTAEVDQRSDDKAGEPEALEVFTKGSSTYLIVAAERPGLLYMYDITDPVAPVFLSVNSYPQDCLASPLVQAAADPESLQYVPAGDHPLGDFDIVISSGAETSTIAIFKVEDAPGADPCAA